MAPRRPIAALAKDRSGVTALVTGLLLTLGLGFTAAAIDLGAAYSAHRSAQNAADSAAFSAANGEMAGATNITDQARAVAAQYGFTDGTGSVAVAVNTPPTAGSFTSNAQAVEVIVTRPQARFFAGFLGVGGGTVRGRAVAVAGVNGNGCVIAFDTAALGSVLLNGNPSVNLAGCSLYANSTSTSAMELNGSVSLNADAINLVGNYSTNGAVHITTTHGIHTGQAAIADPYADVNVPAFSGCDYTNWSPGPGTYAIHAHPDGTPVVFCGGVTLNGNVTVNFDPGIYVMDRGQFLMNGNATVTALHVTFVLTSSTGSNYATVLMNGTTNFTASAPITGPTAGLVFFQDRRATSAGGTDTVNGNSSSSIRGALYFRNQQLTFNGNNATTQGGCTQVLADKVLFNGTPTLEVNCAGAGVRAIGGYSTKLVE
ncbi:pilus assembly protein TadG-related protein [Phenylobacterium sp.]|uniref:pilus assembly protein TadG-related protein n=1 Tax=Phenylobacterium sp. TaxID=1871053 RepID=UPI002DE2B585|nr:pilus assembly protein TadG-related protein [Phenylobacterium sp.]